MPSERKKVDLAADRAVADVGAHLHAVELHLAGGFIGVFLRGLDRVAQAHDAQNAAARNDREAFVVQSGARVEDVRFGVVFGERFDDGALFGTRRIAAGGADDAERRARIPFDRLFVSSEKSLFMRIMMGCVSGSPKRQLNSSVRTTGAPSLPREIMRPA